MSAADRLRLVLRDGEGQPRLSPDLVARVSAALRGAQAPSVVTLEGADGEFCRGLPLETIAPLLETAAAATLGEALDRYGELVTAIGRCARPVLALVDGPAMGGGLGVAAAADVVLATRRAVFALPEALIGLIPVFAFVSLRTRVSSAHARRLAMGGPTLDAEAALRIGLVDEVVDDLDAAAARYAARFRRMDARSIAAVKRVVADTCLFDSPYASAARAEAIKLGVSEATRDRMARFVAGDAPWLAGATA